MKEKHYIITVDENLVIKSAEGNIKRNSNSSQWFDLLLDGWLLNEGEGLYIELLHYDEDAELTTRVGPLYFVFNRDLGRYVTLVPPEVVKLAGEWKYSLELRRYDEADVDKTVTTVITVTDKAGETVSRTTIVKNGADCTALIEEGETEPGEKQFDSLTSAVYSLIVIDSIVSATNGDCNIKESELLTAAEVFYKNVHNAEAANSETKKAQQAAEVAQRAAETAQNAAETAQNSAERAEEAALKHSEDAGAFAADAEREATRAEAKAQAAEASAGQAEASAGEAQTAAVKAGNHEVAAETAFNRAAAEAVNAAESSKAAENWAKQAAELFATHSIKISTECASVADLPTEGNSQTIYFIPNGGENENSFDEYVWVESKAAYEKIGSTEVDLTSYATKAEVADGYATKAMLADEAILRENADQQLTERLTENEQRLEVDYATKAGVAETYATKAEVAETYATKEMLSEETKNRQTQDQRLNTRILANENNLSAEQTARENEVQQLSELISAEETARENADTALENRIDGNEANITTLQSGKVNKSGDTMTGNLSAPVINGTGLVQENGKRVYSPNNPPPIASNYGNNYIRFTNGFQICWGVTTNISGNTDTDVTFPLPFVQTPALVLSKSKQAGWSASWYSAQYPLYAMQVDSTHFRVRNTDFDTAMYRFYIAIGRYN